MNEPKRLDPVLDPATFRRVLGHYPTGVCVITATAPDGKPAAMVVGSFTSVSLDPPLVAFFSDRGSSSWPQIERSGRFCVNVLSADQVAHCKRFSAKGGDKFEGVSYRVSAQGSPMLDDVVAWIDCSLHGVHEAGDHYIVLGRVHELDLLRDIDPLLFYRGTFGGFAERLL